MPKKIKNVANLSLVKQFIHWTMIVSIDNNNTNNFYVRYNSKGTARQTFSYDVRTSKKSISYLFLFLLLFLFSTYLLQIFILSY